MIRIGVVGCGHLGGIHVKLLNASKNFDLIGFLDNDDKRATEISCLLYTSPSPRDLAVSRMPSSA